MWYVYRGINCTKKEVYHGVSESPISRIEKSHCVGGTKSIKHWDCDKDDIIWKDLSSHRTQHAASAKAHSLEKTYKYRGIVKGKFTNILTAGI
jgi:hypothetical protein